VDAVAPTINIRGDSIALGPFHPQQVEHLCRWFNDYGVIRNWAFLPGPRIVENVRKAFEPGEIFDPSESVVFAIYETASWGLVGFTGLVHVDLIDRIGEFFIMIGDQQNRGRGFGTEATRLLLDHAFLGIGLSNVNLRVFEYNLAGIRAYERAGFQRIGVRRKSKFMGGKMWDTVLMDAIADDFTSSVLAHVLVPDRPGPV